MNNLNLYQDIVERTDGDIYLGVVGPVRVGKSTFISKFMQTLVIPNIKDVNIQKRTLDELPQSADGKTIMTTQPKFVPNEAVELNLDNIKANVRLIDCVGYLVDDALGADENGKPRKVKTPWAKEELTLAQSAEIGTKKVITEHSTIAVAITTDGSFGEIPREEFVPSEERIIKELKLANKPFIVILNTTTPQSVEVQNLSDELSLKYDATVVPMNVKELSTNDINEIFIKILADFPLKSIQVKLPLWMQGLPFEHHLIQEVIKEILEKTQDLEKIGQFEQKNLFCDNQNFDIITPKTINMGQGEIHYELKPKENLFYAVLSEQCGMEIKNDIHLVSCVKDLAKAKIEYDKLSQALVDAEETGYGVVKPTISDMQLDEPTVVKQGSRYGVKIHASAPSLHIMKVDLETELTPMVGTQAQIEDFTKYLQSEYEKNPEQLWKINMFGKTLDELIADGMKSKINGIPLEAQKKMRRTLTKIVNEGKGGIICILL